MSDVTELKGLSLDVHPLVSDPNFRTGSQPAVEYEPYVVDLGLGRTVYLEPLRAVLEEAKKRNPAKNSDGWLAPRVHATLRLKRREAADRRLWAYLNVAVFPDFVRWRWLDPDDQDDIVPVDRFLGEDTKNHLGRLWWGAELTRNGTDYARTVRAFGFSQFQRSWQALDVMHHRPASLAIVDFMEQFDGKGTTDAQAERLAKALNAALRTLSLDALVSNPEPDAEALREWMAERIDETKMMDALPRGPDDKEAVSDEAIADVRNQLEELAQAIGLTSYVRKRRPKRKPAREVQEAGAAE
jgi:hypothetical protein